MIILQDILNSLISIEKKAQTHLQKIENDTKQKEQIILEKISIRKREIERENREKLELIYKKSQLEFEEELEVLHKNHRHILRIDNQQKIEHDAQVIFEQVIRVFLYDNYKN